MNVCDNLGDYFVGNVYVKVSFNFLLELGNILLKLFFKRKCFVDI